MNLIIVMGVSGSGKTTVGKLLAQKNDWQFKDADMFHALKNRFKMQQGKALTDRDRRQWLDVLRNAIITWNAQKKFTVLACSALKAEYRQRLVPEAVQAQWVYLKGDYDEIYQRLCQRQQGESPHFMGPDLLKSQFEILEEPDDALTLRISKNPQDSVEEIEAHLKMLEFNSHRSSSMAFI